jgi:hypothetical protein
MSLRDMWKTIHLLYLNQKGPEGVPYSALERAGISCYSDTVEELEHSGVLKRVKDSGLVLSHAARKMLQISTFGNPSCKLTNSRHISENLFISRAKIVLLIVLSGCLLLACAQFKEAGRTIGHTTQGCCQDYWSWDS